jgi:transposase
MTPKIAAQLERHLEESPQKFGLNRARWDGPTLATHLQRQFGVKLKVRQAQYWMHRLGYRLKRASHVYLQARAEDAKKFARNLKKTQNAGS